MKPRCKCRRCGSEEFELLYYCSGCRRYMPSTEFYRRGNRAKGLRSRCKTCEEKGR